MTLSARPFAFPSFIQASTSIYWVSGPISGTGQISIRKAGNRKDFRALGEQKSKARSWFCFFPKCPQWWCQQPVPKGNQKQKQNHSSWQGEGVPSSYQRDLTVLESKTSGKLRVTTTSNTEQFALCWAFYRLTSPTPAHFTFTMIPWGKEDDEPHLIHVLKPREVKSLAQGHTDWKWWSGDPTPDLRSSKGCVLTFPMTLALSQLGTHPTSLWTRADHSWEGCSTWERQGQPHHSWAT